MGTREAKVKAIENYLSGILCEAPLKPELSGCIWNLHEMASQIMTQVEQVEIDRAYAL